MPVLGSVAGTCGFGRQQAQSDGAPTGLLISLDASNSASYGGSGTTWTDTVSGYNGTLTNGPLFTNTAPKYFTFDGTDDYVNIADNSAIRPSIGGAVTAIVWAYVTSYVAFDGLISKMFGSPSYDGFSLLLNTNNVVTLKMNGGSVDGTYNSANNAFSLNTWTMFTVIPRFGGGSGNQSKVYVNATEVVSAANGESSIPVNTAPLRFPSGIQEASPYPACRIGSFYYYNRALSASDINTLFTTTRTRFGV